MAGHTESEKVYDEEDWSNLDGNLDAYAKSKTIAEKAAWNFIKKQDSTTPIELSVINPGFVQGPLLDGERYGTSADTIRRLMLGQYPGTARIMMSIGGVRDVAAAHLEAMLNPAANGNRYLCISEALWFNEIAKILHRTFGNQGYKISTRQLPDFLVRLFARFDKSVESIVDDLGRQIRFSNQRIREDLIWQPRSAEEAIIAMGESLIQLGVI